MLTSLFSSFSTNRCPNTEFFLVRIFLYSDWIQENTDQKQLRIWTLFTQCLHFTNKILELLRIMSIQNLSFNTEILQKTHDFYILTGSVIIFIYCRYTHPMVSLKILTDWHFLHLLKVRRLNKMFNKMGLGHYMPFFAIGKVSLVG